MSKCLFFGEPLIRISPLHAQTLHNQVESQVFFGGSEINIACNLSALGEPCKLLTGLPADEIGERFLNFLKQEQVDTTSVYRLGQRIGLYYLEEGFGCRQSQVFYDREHTSISQLQIEMLDLDAIFQDVHHFHFSGVTIAINEQVRQVLQVLLKEAKKRDITISIDLNLRTKMISVAKAKQIFSQFAHYADYCFGIEPIMSDPADSDLFPRDTASLTDIEQRMRVLKEHYQFKVIFHTYRTTDEQDRNIFQAYALGECFETSVLLKTAVYQRVGSGDAFVSGALYQLFHQAPLKEVVDFAAASATLKCTIAGDILRKNQTDIQHILTQQKGIIR